MSDTATTDAAPDAASAPETGQDALSGGTGRDSRGRFASPATEPGAGNGHDADAAVDGEGDAPSALSDWRQSLPEDLRKSAAKFNSPSDALRSYRELEGRLGKAITVPGSKAKPEEIAEFHRKLGVPDEPAGYGIKVPDELPDGVDFDDGAKQTLNAFVEHMHKLGARPPEVQGAVQFYFDMLGRMQESQQKALERGREEAVEELDRDWGDDKSANLTYARRFRQQFDQDNQFAKFLEEAVIDGRKAGDHPAILRFMATAGRAMSEDSVHLAPDESEAGGINKQIDKVREQKSAALRAGNQSRAMQLDEEERQLYTQLHGGAKIVGAAGRTV